MEPTQINNVNSSQNSTELKGDEAQKYASQNENMRVLSNQILPMALLNQGVSLNDFYCDGIKLTVLNYTPFKIQFNEERILSVNNCSIAAFTKDDCQVIAYQVNGSPNLICFESKDLDKDLSSRFFAKIDYREVIERIKKNLNIVTQNDIRTASGKIALKERANLRNAALLLLHGQNDEKSTLAVIKKDVILTINSIIHKYLQFLDSEFPQSQFLARAKMLSDVNGRIKL